VSITALSAVGAAFSVGAVAVCAPALELNARTPASAATAVSETIPRPIVISLVLNTRRACRISSQASAYSANVDTVLRMQYAQKC
jgi:hypothetical protein